MSPKEIKSSQNPTFKVLQEILETKGIKRHGKALLSGSKVVDEYIQSSRVESVIISEKQNTPKDFKGEILKLSPALFKELDLFGTGTPLAVIKTPKMPEWNEDEVGEGVILFISFQDPSNVGAMIRSAQAFGVKDIVFTEEAANPFHPKSTRAASGTLLKAKFYRGPKLKELKTKKIPLFALDARGEPIKDFQFPKVFGLVAGIEGPGFPKEFSPTKYLSIPMEKNVESLNAMVALSIALYEWRRLFL